MADSMNLKEFALHILGVVEVVPEYGELPMYLSKDGEGNEFRPFCGDFEIMLGEEIDWEHETEKAAVFFPDW